MSDLYQTLGVSKTATASEIKNAFRKLARKYHPDLNPGNKKSEEKFKEVNSAYDILGDEKLRAKYDRGEIDDKGAAQPQYHQGAYGTGQGPFYYETQQGGGRYSSPFEGFDSDIFENIFRNARQSRMDFAGQDEMYGLTINFKDAILGTEQEIALPSGKKLKVKIPAGIETGKKLRFKGLGGPGAGKGPAGDVYVEITVRPSDIFQRHGKNLEIELPITLYEAVLGGEVRVPTLESPVLLKIPAGASTGTKLRVKGKGVKAANVDERGDLIVQLKIVMPEKIDPQLKEAVRAWSEKHSYNPRETLEKEGSH